MKINTFFSRDDTLMSKPMELYLEKDSNEQEYITNVILKTKDNNKNVVKKEEELVIN